MIEDNEYEFPEVGTKVIVPPQDNFSNVVLERLDLEGVPEMDSDEEYFKLGRLVINFVLKESENSGEYITEFNPPIQLQVYFTPADVEFAAVGKTHLGFAFWDGERWIRFTQEKHDITLTPVEDPKWAGYAQMLIRNWGEPAVAVGR
jgi:hypothetical protein